MVSSFEASPCGITGSVKFWTLVRGLSIPRHLRTVAGARFFRPSAKARIVAPTHSY